MKQYFSDWDEDSPPEPEAAYQDLVRALKRNSGFGLYFVQCSPGEAEQVIGKIPQDLPQKKVEVLRLVEPISNLYERVIDLYSNKQFEVLLITGLEYSLYKYEKRKFGEITEGQFSNLSSVPPILNHLNQQRERFRDDFPISFVFLVRSFSLNYLLHRAPDFFDWRSAVFELPTTPEVVELESSRLILEGDYGEYLKLAPEEKIEKILEIQDLLDEQHQTENIRASLQFELGGLLHAAQEYESALASYEKSVKIQPHYPEGWYRRGNALGSLELHAEALASFEQAVRIKCDYYQAWFNKGIALYKLERFKEAIASFDEAVKIKPDYHQAWFKRGVTLDELERYEEAIASFDETIKIKPDSHLAWYNRGFALLNLNRYEDAIASFDAALKLKPDYQEAWNNRGTALLNLKRYEDAIASFDAALKTQPDSQNTGNSQGITLGDLRTEENANTSVNQTVKIQPDLHQAFYNKACCYAIQGNLDSALENLQKAINLNPDKYRKRAKTDTNFDGIRKDERFQALIQ
ncbi:tetratricopeptide repeat protein [Cylindrospermum stagnale PCC 7417]|uniref:Tetratricopeptide repeat protein n=1 Tax=Cylindrospermum stagnale PCC 7417 TaxID=56107 RepID=K9X2N9_9NOST|nr:tetratricopeptide repeat protein [Cylindrospermum stagnale]AFZ26349.1 tetratricopeptide repeat protein [Cylindrospermum stagnale PCC 7417]